MVSLHFTKNIEAMNYNCPICNQPGLPDYTANDVVCPRCNSELNSFRLLHSIQSKSKTSTYIILGLVLLFVASLGMLLKGNDTNQKLVAELAFLNAENANLNVRMDSLAMINVPPPVHENSEVTINYTVKKGDCPYKIAEFFYGDGSKYKQIEADNNLVKPYRFKIGQTLVIKISQDNLEKS